LAALVAGASYKELSALGGAQSWRFPIVPLLVLAGYAAYALLAPSWIPLAQLFGLTLLGCIVAPLWLRRKKWLLLETASLWCVSPLVSLGVLQVLYTPAGYMWWWKTPLLLVVLPLWVGDTLAYFIGRSFGKHLLAPKISPKKTVEGGIANLIGCLGAAYGVGVLIGVPPAIAVGCGLIAGVLGQVGDLYESSLKRLAGLKDTGALLPGHGGILDRIDSLLLVAPAQALFLMLTWPPHFSR
jgi:phosphatidate cytidylyltransferase